MLKKVNFLEWSKTNTTREHIVTSRFNLSNRDDYKRYNRIVGDDKKAF